MDGSWAGVVIEVVQVVELLSVLVILAVAGRQWWQTRERSTLWVVLAFGSLALILGVGIWSPSDEPPRPLQALLLIALVCFPFLLVCFAHAVGAVRSWGMRLSMALVGCEVVATLVLPPLPADGAERPTW
jgi:hypothetical protein